MGSGIVSNLLKMGHTVTVWNRTAEKVSIKGEVCHMEGGITEGGYSVVLLSVLHPGKGAKLSQGRRIYKMLL